MIDFVTIKKNISTAFLLFLSFGLEAQVSLLPEVVDFSFTDCDNKCYADHKIKENILNNEHVLLLNFNALVECSDYKDISIVKSDTDTLSLSIVQSNRAWKRTGTQAFEESPLKCCYCFFNFTVRISNVAQTPKIIIVNDEIHHEYLGFIHPEIYGLNKTRTKFSDNSASLNYEEINRALGKPVSSPLFKNLCAKLGGDYIAGDIIDAWNFPEDHLIVRFDTLGTTVESIVVDSSFSGKLPVGIKLTDRFDILVKKLGMPDLQIISYSKRYDENGKEAKMPYAYTYYYKAFNLALCFDSESPPAAGIKASEVRFEDLNWGH